HVLVVHGSPLLKVRSNNFMERDCYPGAKQHNCEEGDPCEYDEDCGGDMYCDEGHCETG
ncbi:44268_t:CDS:2, partial [Gigaspora margarita]